MTSDECIESMIKDLMENKLSIDQVETSIVNAALLN